MTLKILQLSDSHLSADREADYRGLNADRKLQSLLPAVRAWAPDLVLLTGDISEDASEASYARAALMLGTIGVPLLAIPGNHDNPEVMKKHFPQGSWKGPFAQQAGPWLLVLMDSTERGKIAGSFSQRYLERLDSLLRGNPADYILIALHHQPVPVNSPWIDRVPLEKPERFLKLVSQEPRIRCVVWGHIHQDFRLKNNGVTLLGAPSAAANSLPGRERFTLDMEGPACRWLELSSTGEIETGLLRPA